MHSLGDWLSEQSKKSDSKGIEAKSRIKEVSELEKQEVDISGELDLFEAQDTAVKALSEGARTA